jgi:RND family efflux transporter MFP subunit
MQLNLKKWFTRKRIIWGVIILVILIGGYFLFFNKKLKQDTLTVHPEDFLQQVSASGKIVAQDDLDLSFEEPGQVSSVNVKVGDNVYTGQLLASQSTGQLAAQLAGMQAGIELQEAKLNQLLAGNSPEDIQTGKDNIAAAQQNLDNNYNTLKNTLNDSYTSLYDAYTKMRYIQQTYFNGTGAEDLNVQSRKNAINTDMNDAKKYIDLAKGSLNASDWDIAASHVATDLNDAYSQVAAIRQQCEEGIYYTSVSSTDKAAIDTQKSSLNTAASSTISAQSSIASYKVALTQANSALALKQAPARQSDIAVYKAQVAQAKANAQDVIAQLNKKRIYSPIFGIVTAVNAKVGRIFSSQDVAISVISKNTFQVESYVPEINISLIKTGQDADVTLDSYGDASLPATVAAIDPAETIKDGVSTYKVTLAFKDNDDRIKSGMTGTVTITTNKKSMVLSIPQGAVHAKDGQKVVIVKTGQDAKDITEKVVTTGSVASNGNVEILSGLNDGDVVVLN